jgi:LCP family protein required for cell wall assembly
VSGSHVTTTGEIGTSLENPIGTPTGMDILVLGSDKRPTNAGEETRSDTVMLVHADPKANYLSILSLPRDLRVEIPGHGTGKLNDAYSIGGWELTAATVEQLTNVEIKQYVGVDFQAFKDMTNTLGGVYVDVDQRYYNDDPTYELIKLSPGYQLLNGDQALDYVRFRHDLNMDFGRMARQQRFLAAVREQAMGWNLAFKLPGLVSSIFKNLQTTLGTTDVLKLAYWGFRLSGDRIRQISVIGDIQTIGDPPRSYVIPAEGAVAAAVQKLMTSPTGTSTETTSSAESTTGTEGGTTTSTTVDTSAFITDPIKIENSHLWSELASGAPFQVMAPGYLPEGYAYVDRMPATGGTYDIAVGGGTKPAIKMVYRLTRQGEATDQYLGLMETTWLDAPAASAGREVEYNGVTYTIVATSQNTDHVWWKENGVLYWVSNTLQYYLNAKDLLKVAESMIVIPSGVAH